MKRDATGKPRATKEENVQAKIQRFARTYLTSYACLMNDKYETPEHIKEIAHILEQVEKGKKKRVIITIPPRCGKSMLASQFFPAFYLGRNPDKYIICATYGQDLSDDFGRKVREQMLSPEYNFLFPDVRLKKETRAANRFETKQQGIYYSVGAGGAITGKGAHLLLIDDILKSREDADSRAKLDHIWEWYKHVAYTRLQSGGAVVVIMARWCEDDLVGRLLKEHQHENWEVFNMPAISADGKALWPEMYDIDALEVIKKTLGPFGWATLYQQNPIPREGNIVKIEWIKGLYPQKDQIKYIYAAVDPAISKRDSADETSVCVGAIGYGDPPPIYELETIHGHWDFATQIRMIEQVDKRYKLSMLGCEDVAYQKALGQVLQSKGLPVVQLPADHDKVRRAMMVTPMMEQGRVFINSPDLIRQLLSFRGGSEKNDLAESLFYLLSMVNRFAPTKIIREQDEPELVWSDQLIYDRVQRFKARRKKQRQKNEDGNDPFLGTKW